MFIGGASGRVTRRSNEMVDFETAKALAHKRNLERYRLFLRTELTAYERKYILQRISLELAELERIAQLCAPRHPPTPVPVGRGPHPLAPSHLTPARGLTGWPLWSIP
jgi:hypothetical protein